MKQEGEIAEAERLADRGEEAIQQAEQSPDAIVMMRARLARMAQEASSLNISLIPTETKKQLLQARTEKALRYDRLGSLEQQAAGVAHDLRNFLQTISGAVFLALLDNTLCSDTERMLQAAQMATEASTSMVERLERIIGSNVDSPVLRAINMKSLLDDVIVQISVLKDQYAEKYGLKHIRISSDCQDDLRVLGEFGGLTSVILNLIKNSIEAMPKAAKLRDELPFEGEIMIEAKEFNDSVYLTVSDNGIGMDKETQLSAFIQRFTTKRQDKPRGLGMGQVKRIVEELQGKIGIKFSSPGIGTIVEMYLPLAPVECALPTPLDDTNLEIVTPLPVLFVDDDELVRDVTSKILEALGCEVVCASNGEDALKLLDEKTFALVFTDMNMPDMNGLVLSANIKKSHPGMPVVLMSGDQLPVLHEQMDQYGVSQVIQKPYQFADLGNILCELVGEKAAKVG